MHALKLYGPRTGRQNSYGAARGPCGPREWTYDFCSKQPGNSPYGARECDVTEALPAPYGFWECKQPMNSPFRDRKGPYGPRTAKYDARAGFLPIVVVLTPLRARKGAVRHPCGSRTGPVRVPWDMKNIEDSRASPVSARARGGGGGGGTRGVLRIIQPNHKYADVSSRTGPVAWCDHGNSTDVKFLRALHSALRARNRAGDKNRTGAVVGCDWGIMPQSHHTHGPRMGCSRAVLNKNRTSTHGAPCGAVRILPPGTGPVEF